MSIIENIRKIYAQSNLVSYIKKQNRIPDKFLARLKIFQKDEH